MPPLVTPPTQTEPSKIPWLAWFVVLLELIPIGVLLLMATVTWLGQCNGALGSGVSCERFDVGPLIMGGEILLIMLGVLCVPLSFIGFIVGVVKLFQRKRDGAGRGPLKKDPYLYLVLMPFVFLFLAPFISFVLFLGTKL